MHYFYLCIPGKTDCLTSAAIAAPPHEATLPYEKDREEAFDDSKRIKLLHRYTSANWFGQE